MDSPSAVSAGRQHLENVKTRSDFAENEAPKAADRWGTTRQGLTTATPGGEQTCALLQKRGAPLRVADGLGCAAQGGHHVTVKALELSDAREAPAAVALRVRRIPQLPRRPQSHCDLRDDIPCKQRHILTTHMYHLPTGSIFAMEGCGIHSQESTRKMAGIG